MKMATDPTRFVLSQTFGIPFETDKDRAKRKIMEFMPPLVTNDEIIIVDPEARSVDDIGLPVKETNILNFNT